MVCSFCGGLVEWQGPWSNLTHTQCRRCGRTNCQEPEAEVVEDEPEEDEAGA